MDAEHPEPTGGDAHRRRAAPASGAVSSVRSAPGQPTPGPPAPGQPTPGPLAPGQPTPGPPTPDSPAQASPDLARLLRWEDSGGGWRVVGVGSGSLTLSLVTCDGGEEMEVLTSADPAVLGHVAGRPRHP